MDDFPCAKKFNRITASYPVLNHIRRSAVPLFGKSHVGKRYIILFFKIKNGNQCVLNDNFRHYVIDALSFDHKGTIIHKIISFPMNYLQKYGMEIPIKDIIQQKLPQFIYIALIFYLTLHAKIVNSN